MLNATAGSGKTAWLCGRSWRHAPLMKTLRANSDHHQCSGHGDDQRDAPDGFQSLDHTNLTRAAWTDQRGPLHRWAMAVGGGAAQTVNRTDHYSYRTGRLHLGAADRAGQADDVTSAIHGEVGRCRATKANCSSTGRASSQQRRARSRRLIWNNGSASAVDSARPPFWIWVPSNRRTTVSPMTLRAKTWQTDRRQPACGCQRGSKPSAAFGVAGGIWRGARAGAEPSAQPEDC